MRRCGFTRRSLRPVRENPRDGSRGCVSRAGVARPRSEIRSHAGGNRNPRRASDCRLPEGLPLRAAERAFRARALGIRVRIHRRRRKRAGHPLSRGPCPRRTRRILASVRAGERQTRAFGRAVAARRKHQFSRRRRADRRDGERRRQRDAASLQSRSSGIPRLERKLLRLRAHSRRSASPPPTQSVRCFPSRESSRV